MARVRLRAWMVSNVAPHTPTSPLFVKRHGPMPHCLQHIPAPPMLHGTILSARVKAVPIPNSSARINICCAAGAVENSSIVRFLAIVHLLIHLDRADARALPKRTTLITDLLCEADCLFNGFVGGSVPEERFLSIP